MPSSYTGKMLVLIMDLSASYEGSQKKSSRASMQTSLTLVPGFKFFLTRALVTIAKLNFPGCAFKCIWSSVIQSNSICSSTVSALPL